MKTLSTKNQMIFHFFRYVKSAVTEITALCYLVKLWSIVIAKPKAMEISTDYCQLLLVADCSLSSSQTSDRNTEG